MDKIGRILYVHAPQHTKRLTPGHWFYHTGQCAQCAETGRTKDGRWYVRLEFSSFGKELPKNLIMFENLEEVKRFVGEYFELPIVRVPVREFLAQADL
jgi:hypothetical protein